MKLYLTRNDNTRYAFTLVNDTLENSCCFQNEIAEILREMVSPGSEGNKFQSAFSQPDVHNSIKAAMAAKFPTEQAKPWYIQIRTKFDRLSTGEPGFLRRLIASTLLATRVIADFVRAGIGREPTQDDYIVFLGNNDDARKVVYDQVLFLQVSFRYSTALMGMFLLLMS